MLEILDSFAGLLGFLLTNHFGIGSTVFSFMSGALRYRWFSIIVVALVAAALHVWLVFSYWIQLGIGATWLLSALGLFCAYLVLSCGSFLLGRSIAMLFGFSYRRGVKI